jgi:hypothetical protein
LNHLVQGTTTRGNVVAVIAKGEQAEFLTYFPEYSDVFAEIQDAIARFAEEQDALLSEVLSANYATRKELAAFVVRTPCPACLFTLLDGKSPSARDWLLALPARKILHYIGVQE